MLDHHLQRSIVYELAFRPGARFSELKPDDVENKLFTYHLQKVIKAGYVEKDSEGLYRLTAEGRRLGFQAIKTDRFMLEKAYSVLFLVVRRQDGAWLFSKRKVHPLIGYTTFPIATPSADLHADRAAARDLQAKTGLTGNFRALGGGYFHMYRGTELESYTNFTLMICENATGELTQQDENAEYAWYESFEPGEHHTLPDMTLLIERYQLGEPFFLEQTLDLGDM